jgi:polar amino acid transport system permease protein
MSSLSPAPRSRPIAAIALTISLMLLFFIGALGGSVRADITTASLDNFSVGVLVWALAQVQSHFWLPSRHCVCR